jgi:hypothetical protein
MLRSLMPTRKIPRHDLYIGSTDLSQSKSLMENALALALGSWVSGAPLIMSSPASQISSWSLTGTMPLVDGGVVLVDELGFFRGFISWLQEYNRVSEQ